MEVLALEQGAPGSRSLAWWWCSPRSGTHSGSLLCQPLRDWVNNGLSAPLEEWFLFTVTPLSKLHLMDDLI